MAVSPRRYTAPDQAPRPEGREGNGKSEGEDRWAGRDRPRPRLPALHTLRAQGLGGRGRLLNSLVVAWPSMASEAFELR
jgi:hypothetical protein